MSEAKDAHSKETVGCCLRSTTLTRAGIKIGFIGIAEREWIDLFKDLEENIIYQNYKRSASEEAKVLREKEGCEYVIALTHMRIAHDKKLACEVPGVDLVLGGHDHEYHCHANEHNCKDEAQGPQVQNKTVPLVKSGTDFLDMTEIDITFGVKENQFKVF